MLKNTLNEDNVLPEPFQFFGGPKKCGSGYIHVECIIVDADICENHSVSVSAFLQDIKTV